MFNKKRTEKRKGRGGFLDFITQEPTKPEPEPEIEEKEPIQPKQTEPETPTSDYQINLTTATPRDVLRDLNLIYFDTSRGSFMKGSTWNAHFGSITNMDVEDVVITLTLLHVRGGDEKEKGDKDNNIRIPAKLFFKWLRNEDVTITFNHIPASDNRKAINILIPKKIEIETETKSEPFSKVLEGQIEKINTGFGDTKSVEPEPEPEPIPEPKEDSESESESKYINQSLDNLRKKFKAIETETDDHGKKIGNLLMQEEFILPKDISISTYTKEIHFGSSVMKAGTYRITNLLYRKPVRHLNGTTLLITQKVKRGGSLSVAKYGWYKTELFHILRAIGNGKIPINAFIKSELFNTLKSNPLIQIIKEYIIKEGLPFTTLYPFSINKVEFKLIANRDDTQIYEVSLTDKKFENYQDKRRLILKLEDLYVNNSQNIVEIYYEWYLRNVEKIQKDDIPISPTGATILDEPFTWRMVEGELSFRVIYQKRKTDLVLEIEKLKEKSEDTELSSESITQTGFDLLNDEGLVDRSFLKQYVVKYLKNSVDGLIKHGVSGEIYWDLFKLQKDKEYVTKLDKYYELQERGDLVIRKIPEDLPLLPTYYDYITKKEINLVNYGGHDISQGSPHFFTQETYKYEKEIIDGINAKFRENKNKNKNRATKTRFNVRHQYNLILQRWLNKQNTDNFKVTLSYTDKATEIKGSKTYELNHKQIQLLKRIGLTKEEKPYIVTVESFHDLRHTITRLMFDRYNKTYKGEKIYQEIDVSDIKPIKPIGDLPPLFGETPQNPAQIKPVSDEYISVTVNDELQGYEFDVHGKRISIELFKRLRNNGIGYNKKRQIYYTKIGKYGKIQNQLLNEVRNELKK